MKWVVGIDEVGRGPLAGPVTVCALAVPAHEYERYKGNFDSKRATLKDREELWEVCKGLAKNKRLAFTIASVSNTIIDKKGISFAVRLAIKRCLARLGVGHPMFDSKIILDGGLRAPSEYINQQTVIGGDRKVPLIGMASMLAKVHRDRKMGRLVKKYPHYGLEKHKGYGTRAHYAALKKHGLSEIHRRSFLKKII